jgi:hypothetical protein
MLIIDFHSHVFPDWIEETAHSLPVTWAPDLNPLQNARRKLRDATASWMRTVHENQTLLRTFPKPIQAAAEWIGGAATAPHLLVESTPLDLLESMRAAEVNFSVIIASPPFASNDFVLDLASKNSKLIPAVFSPDSTEQFQELIKRGAKLLKLHPAQEGIGPGDEKYLELLEAAQDQKMPVILHTGCIHLDGFYKNSSFGDVEIFRPWFEKFEKIQFVLAHMNFNQPEAALNLCEEFPNLYVDTSWQPAETISEAVRRIGSERVLLGSDWPLVGGNMKLAVERVMESASFGVCKMSDIENILGKSALKLLAHANLI